MSQEEMISEIMKLRKVVDSMSEDNKMLLQVADRGRIENYRGKKRILPKTIVRVSKLGEKIVVAWRTLVDEVYQDSNSVWHEKQVIEVTTEDGKTHVMPLVDRYRVLTKVDATVVSKKRDNEGIDGEDLHEIFDIHLIDEDRDITIDGNFIN